MKKTVSNQVKAVKSATGRTLTQKGERRIVIPLTEKQYKIAEELCRSYRVKPEEVALFGFVNQLHQDEDQWHSVMEMAAKTEKTGIHPDWEYAEAALKNKQN